MSRRKLIDADGCPVVDVTIALAGRFRRPKKRTPSQDAAFTMVLSKLLQEEGIVEGLQGRR